MFTPAQIDAATADALAKMSLKLQDASHEDSKALNARYIQSLVVQDAEVVKQTAALQAQVAPQLSKNQLAFQNLLSMCMQATTRTLTTASTDVTRADAAVNAVEMAIAAWPTYQAHLDTLP